jgi:hypothetical protein
MPSSTLRTLIATERMLRASFVDFGRDPLGRYTPRQVARGAGYLVLAHAAVEQYFEDTCRKIVLTSKKKFMERNRVSYVLAFILNHSEITRPVSREKPARDKLKSRIVEAFVAHEVLIDRNDGLKEANLCSLFFPVGFNFDTIDPLFLPEANSFGRDRGTLAHKSIRTQKFDPVEGVEAVERILKFIADKNGFDSRITEFARSHA